MKYFSTFTGVGGLDVGLRDIGAECVGYSEIKKTSLSIYSRHFPEHKNFGDITKIKVEEIPNFDVMTGGFPCQSFSLAGLRGGMKDRRGQMIFYIYDILQAKKPKYAVFENVTGLLMHDFGKTFSKILSVLREAGYFVRVLSLNPLFYGSAQSRERLIFLCSSEDFIAKNPEKRDDSKRFRDIRGGVFRLLPMGERNKRKIEQLEVRNFELIGGYDRVGTLTTQYGCGEKAVWEDGQWRYLSVLECERLQGFPDGWTEGVSDSARYWALGNAVSVDVSRYLFLDYLKGVWW